MKKMIFLLTILSVLAFSIIGCGSSSKPINVNHSVNKVPFALTLKFQDFDGRGTELSSISDILNKYLDMKKYYFVIVKSKKRLMNLVDISCHDDFIKLKLSTLGDDFFSKNRLIVVFSYGNATTREQIKNIQKNKNTLTAYRIPNFGFSDASVGADCYVIGVPSDYAKGITNVNLTYVEEDSE